MKLTQFSQTWNGMKLENQWNRILLAFLGGSVLLLSLTVFNQRPAVVVMPPEMTEQGEILANEATQSFHRSWSHHVAQTIGNVSPGNSAFVRESIEPLLAPSIYEEVLVVIERQLDEIESNQISFSFEPREIIHEKDTGVTYVTGLHFLHKGSGNTERVNRTYEFEWKFEEYRPLLESIRTYEGGPRTDDERGGA